VIQDVRVEQFRKEQTDALLRFLRVAYAGEKRKSEPAFWKWHYLENPNTKIDDVPLWVVAYGDEIVGQLATIPVQLKVGSETRPAIWILDFIVREDFRGKGLGKRLVLAAREKYSTTITLGINEQSAGLFRSMGWMEMGCIHRYQKLLYAGNGLKGAAQIPPLRGVLNLLSMPLRTGITKAARRNSYAVSAVNEFGAEFDDLWERVSRQWLCVARRDARTLAWQFELQPGKKFETIGLYSNKRLVGYAVLFFRKGKSNTGPSKAAISDLCYEQENAAEIVDTLIEAALRRAMERRAGSLVTDVLDKVVEERLKQYGFWKIAKSPQFMAWATEASDVICKPENWFLTRGDSDVSIMEEPNQG
jgi:GNAT superfamily N-acetyltransferase